MTKISFNSGMGAERSCLWNTEKKNKLAIWSRTEIVKLIRDHLVEIDRLLIQWIDQNQLIGGTNCLNGKSCRANKSLQKLGKNRKFEQWITVFMKRPDKYHSRQCNLYWHQCLKSKLTVDLISRLVVDCLLLIQAVLMKENQVIPNVKTVNLVHNMAIEPFVKIYNLRTGIYIEQIHKSGIR